MITIVACDNNQLLLEGIEMTILRTHDMKLMGRACNVRELMSILDQQLPNILTMEIMLPGCCMIEVLKNLTRRYPWLPVLIVSAAPHPGIAMRTLRAGAKGYLMKADSPEKLAAAIRKIITQKKRYLSPAIAEQLASMLNGGPKPLHLTLSDREFEVLCLTANGKTTAEVADILLLSPATIHTYRSRIKEKLNISSDVDMTRYAFKHQLID